MKRIIGGFYSQRATEGNSLVRDENHFQAISYFVKQLELLVPEVIDDLKLIYDTYDQAYHWYKEQKDFSLFPEEWPIVKKATTNFCPTYILLKDQISSWAHKYNLIGDYDYYESLGLASLASFHDDCQESNRQERLESYKSIAEMRDIDIEDLRRYKPFYDSWPYEEKLLLSEHVLKVESLENIELSRSIGYGIEIDRSFFENRFPFVFTPDSSGKYGDQPRDVNSYEKIKSHFQLVQYINDNQDTISIKAPLYFGLAWDPRTELWKEFEDSLDKMYAEYKIIYRERAERFLQDNGYTKKGTKRNIKHLKWLIHSRIQGWSNVEIADYYSREETIGEDTISHGVKSAAKLTLLAPARKRK